MVFVCCGAARGTAVAVMITSVLPSATGSTPRMRTTTPVFVVLARNDLNCRLPQSLKV